MNFDFIASLFFPRICLACERSIREGMLCDGCRRSIKIARELWCAACEVPLPVGAIGSRCHPSFPYILGAAGNYENNALKALIHALKFRGVQAAAEPLALILAEYASGLALNFEGFAVVPVPLSRERYRARGFNQAESIATLFAERMGLPLQTSWLARVKHAKPQSETESAAERKENIRGCFAVPDIGTGTAAVRGKKIILVDDVSTSGATFLEAASTLKSADAATLIAFAAAKA